ncbi:unnamed protein product [Amoebophrya sp. A25]|nr:unnamed protein product [Amoebophrya sp. A25]|eukprot:GSA25T00017151001.1
MSPRRMTSAGTDEGPGGTYQSEASSSQSTQNQDSAVALVAGVVDVAPAGAAGSGNALTSEVLEERDVSWALLGTLFFGGFIQLAGVESHLRLVMLLKVELQNDMWPQMMALPYAFASVFGIFFYTGANNLRRKLHEEQHVDAGARRPSSSTAAARTPATVDGPTSTTTPEVVATRRGEPTTAEAVLRCLTFHNVLLGSLSVMALCYFPLMSIAIHFRSTALAVLSLVTMGFALQWFGACVAALTATQVSTAASLAYMCGMASAGWPMTICLLLFTAIPSWKETTEFGHMLFILNAALCFVYYATFYRHVLRDIPDPLLLHHHTTNIDEQDHSGTTSKPPQHVDHEIRVKKHAQQPQGGQEADGNDNRPLQSLLLDSWRVVFSLYLLWAITFTVFPSQVFVWKIQDGFEDAASLPPGGYYNILMIVWTLGDGVGRFLPGFTCPCKRDPARGEKLPFFFESTANLLTAVVLRGAIGLPLFYLFRAGDVGAATFPLHIVVVLSFTVTHGHFTANCFIRSGEKAQTDVEHGMMGPVMNCALVLGIFTGSLIQFLLGIMP